jgi:hypothetical protein
MDWLLRGNFTPASSAQVWLNETMSRLHTRLLRLLAVAIVISTTPCALHAF